jgi:hypothetical protein
MLSSLVGIVGRGRLLACTGFGIVQLNIYASHGAFYHADPLPALIHTCGARSTIALEKFLKSGRVQTSHLPEKRNRANEVVPRLASTTSRWLFNVNCTVTIL